MTHSSEAARVFTALQAIAADPGKLAKEQLVKKAGTELPMFLRVVKAAYDPFTTYGMRNVPERTAGPGALTLDDEAPWQVLRELSTRALSGAAAWSAVQDTLNSLDDASGQLFIRIIRRDLRAGFTEGTINRVFPKTILEFPYMRCSLPPKSNMPDWDWSVGIISQEKADGMFVNMTMDSVGNLMITSRQGTPIPLDHIGDLAIACANALQLSSQTHGEITVYYEGKLLPREEGNGVMNSIAQGGELPPGHTLRFDAWDQIPLAAVQPKGKCDLPYKKRLASLAMQVQEAGPPARKDAGIFVIPTRIVRSKAEAMAHYRELLKLGKEGTICKHPEAIWKDGTSKDQVKLKLEVDVDLQVIDVVPGTPGTKTEGRAGALRCATSCGLLVTNVTIKNEDMRNRVDAANDAFIGTIFPVRANAIMEADDPDGLSSLFLPRFVEAQPRTDKTQADSLEQVRDQFTAAVNA